MGMRGSDTSLIYLDDVRVPAKNIIGDAGMGFTYQMLQFQEERLACAALTITPMGLHVQVEVWQVGERGGGLLSPVLGWDGFHQRGSSQSALQRPPADLYRRRGRRGYAGDYLQDYGHPS